MSLSKRIAAFVLLAIVLVATGCQPALEAVEYVPATPTLAPPPTQPLPVPDDDLLPTAAPSSLATQAPTPVPTPTRAPTQKPTQTPGMEPTATASAEPSALPGTSPSASPSPSGTPHVIPSTTPDASSSPTPGISPAPTASAAPSSQPSASPAPVEAVLAGMRISIDPGHQRKGNSEKEPIAPGSPETKAKVSSGTQGVKTRVPEYEVTLAVGLLLKDKLEALGAEVLMTRETHDVDVSNIKRAQMANDFRAHAAVRLHCDGWTDPTWRGLGFFVRKTGGTAEQDYVLAEALSAAMSTSTGAKSRAIVKNDTYTGLNWSTIPVVLVEMGFMSNPEEDVLLNTPEYQQKLADGLAQGLIDFLTAQP